MKAVLLYQERLSAHVELDRFMTTEQLVIPGHITRAFVRQHRELIFVYGIDIQLSRIDGQPYEFVSEDNTYSVPTMERYCPSQKIFFSDGLFTHYANFIDDAIDKIAQQAFISKRPVIVCPKIGMGCSRLNELAPRLYAHMTRRLNQIKHPDIQWKYNVT